MSKDKKFSYNENFFAVKPEYRGNNFLKLVQENQAKNDFYETPQPIVDKITEDIIKSFGDDNIKINILEPSAGLGTLLTGIIEYEKRLTIGRIDAIELFEPMYELLKKNVKISHIYNDNFLSWIPEYKYDVIVMNPPFEGHLTGDFGVSKVAYLYHLMKALLILERSKTIYIVMPQFRVNHDVPYFELDDALSKADIKKMKELFGVSTLPNAIIKPLMINVGGWKKIVFSRGKFKEQDIGLTLNLYKITSIDNEDMQIPNKFLIKDVEPEPEPIMAAKESKLSKLTEKLLQKQQEEEDIDRMRGKRKVIDTDENPRFRTLEGLENLLDDIKILQKQLDMKFKKHRDTISGDYYGRKTNEYSINAETIREQIKNYRPLTEHEKSFIETELKKGIESILQQRKEYIIKSYKKDKKKGIPQDSEYKDIVDDASKQIYPIPEELFNLYLELNPYTTEADYKNRKKEFQKYVKKFETPKTEPKAKKAPKTKAKKEPEPEPEPEPAPKPMEREPIKASAALKEKVRLHREAKAAKAAKEAHDILMAAIQEQEPAQEPAQEPKQEKKKITAKKPSKTMNIRMHLQTLSLTKLKDIARKSNLHTHIKLTSPKEKLIEAIAQLYEHENGKYKSRPFELKL